MNNQVHNRIIKNKKVINKFMSESQVKYFIKTCCYYDIHLPDLSHWTVGYASTMINALSRAINNGKYKRRAKPYRFIDLWLKFIEVHPEVYEKIINRDS